MTKVERLLEVLGLGGSETCRCPNCGKVYSHERGIPCIEKICIDCKVPLIGNFCSIEGENNT